MSDCSRSGEQGGNVHTQLYTVHNTRHRMVYIFMASGNNVHIVECSRVGLKLNKKFMRERWHADNLEKREISNWLRQTIHFQTYIL